MSDLASAGMSFALRRLARVCAPAFAALCASAALLAPAAVRAEAPLDLKFAQFFQQPVGPQGLSLSDTLHAADGREVRMVGYMVAQEMPRAGRFWLTARPVRLSEHADDEAGDLPANVLTVLLDPSQQERLVAHRAGLVVVTGRLSVGRVEDGSGRVSWVRLQLPPDALASDPTAPAPDTHGHGHAHGAH